MLFSSRIQGKIIYNLGMKSVPSLEDRFQGCVLGLAIGDALGYPTEFLSLPEIQKRYGPNGIQELSGNPALHSDDTQTSMAVARALIESELVSAGAQALYVGSLPIYRVAGRTNTLHVRRIEG